MCAGGGGGGVPKADKFTTLVCRLSWNLGASTSWNPQGPLQACNGIALPFTITTTTTSTTTNVIINTAATVAGKSSSQRIFEADEPNSAYLQLVLTSLEHTTPNQHAWGICNIAVDTLPHEDRFSSFVFQPDNLLKRVADSTLSIHANWSTN